MSIAARGWKIVQIIITVCRTSRSTEEMKDWKKPFKKLKFSTVRVEKEWAILLDVNDKDLKKIYSLLEERYLPTPLILGRSCSCGRGHLHVRTKVRRSAIRTSHGDTYRHY